jgi:hypothetical protein
VFTESLSIIKDNLKISHYPPMPQQLMVTVRLKARALTGTGLLPSLAEVWGWDLSCAGTLLWQVVLSWRLLGIPAAGINTCIKST